MHEDGTISEKVGREERERREEVREEILCKATSFDYLGGLRGRGEGKGGGEEKEVRVKGILPTATFF